MSETWRSRIVVDPSILAGKPVIKGTRLSVDFILDLLASGWTTEGIIENYPQLITEDVLASLRYASNIIKEEVVYPYP